MDPSFALCADREGSRRKSETGLNGKVDFNNGDGSGAQVYRSDRAHLLLFSNKQVCIYGRVEEMKLLSALFGRGFVGFLLYLFI